jgi:ABC-type multidrug transport system fused ATPase/permease subunit
MFGGDFYSAEEEAKTSGQGLKLLPRIWPFFRKYRQQVIVAGSMLVVSTGLSLLGPLLLRHAIDADITRDLSIPHLLRTAAVYLVLQLAVFGIGYFQRVALAVVGENAAADLKEKLFQHILKLPMSFFDKNPVGRLITRTESDTEALKQLFATTAVVLAQDIVLLVGMSVVMAVVNWKLFLIVIALFPPFLFAFTWFQKKARPVYVQVRRTVAEINNFINETIRGLAVVQSLSRQDYFGAKMDQLNQQKFGNEMKVQWYWYRVWFLVDFGEVLGFVLVLGIGGIWALRDILSIGSLFLFVSYITRVFQPIRGLSDQINVMQRALASAERMFGIFDAEPEQAETGLGSAPCLENALQIENVDFGYEGRERVLQGINLKVAKGEKVALVGETGGGKTSIASLLMKFYEPQTGRILIDGCDLKGLDNRGLRRQVGFVPQEVILFPGSVLDNLRLFDTSVSAEQVHAAARQARIHEKILQFPAGYATSLIERGINLSLGERQLLAFARALVFNPAILILDEATSSVDPHTELLIQLGLEALLKGRTAIIIAHRLATIEMCDRIVVVHKGRIVQQGSHRELVNQDGYYQRLYRLQYLNSGAA